MLDLCTRCVPSPPNRENLYMFALESDLVREFQRRFAEPFLRRVEPRG